jgi:hypothetical protein
VHRKHGLVGELSKHTRRGALVAMSTRAAQPAGGADGSWPF